MQEQVRVEKGEYSEYKVLVNHEEQYALCSPSASGLAERTQPIPAGWRDAGFSGSREACLAYIDEIWTDMRPASLRQRLAESAARPAPAVSPKPAKSAKSPKTAKSAKSVKVVAR